MHPGKFFNHAQEIQENFSIPDIEVTGFFPLSFNFLLSNFFKKAYAGLRWLQNKPAHEFLLSFHPDILALTNNIW